MYNVSQTAVPSTYPLALSGLGYREGPPRTSAAPDQGAAYAQRVNDLDSFGLISPIEKVVVGQLIQRGDYKQAEMILAAKEQKALSKKGKVSWFDQVDNYIPAGYRLREELISGVPNWGLYAVGIASVYVLQRRWKRRGG